MQKKFKENSAPAPCNTVATTAVRVSLSSGLAIVIGSAASGTWHGVPLQCTVADVLGGRQNAPADLGVQLELFPS